MQAVKEVLFAPTVQALFGAEFCSRHGPAALADAFFGFESGFELAASPLPHILQRSFSASRSRLLANFR